jgi:hypothetical protein
MRIDKTRKGGFIMRIELVIQMYSMYLSRFIDPSSFVQLHRRHDDPI